jgi:hypothetical protein
LDAKERLQTIYEVGVIFRVTPSQARNVLRTVPVANPPGGTYKAADAAEYVAKGHHAAVFVSASRR